MQNLHVVTVTVRGGAHGFTASVEDNQYTRASIDYCESNLFNALSDLREAGFAIDRRTCINPTIGLELPTLDCLLTSNQCRFGFDVNDEIADYDGKISIKAMKDAGVKYISPKLYADLCRKHGALIGTRNKNVVLWEHDVSTEIPKHPNPKWKPRFSDPWLPLGWKNYLQKTYG